MLTCQFLTFFNNTLAFRYEDIITNPRFPFAKTNERKVEGGMKIKKIQLKNGYKRFKDLTINLGDSPRKIVALVGPNGCGKSSVFDGMLFLTSAYEAIGQFNRRDYKYHSMEGVVDFSHDNVVMVIGDAPHLP